MFCSFKLRQNIFFSEKSGRNCQYWPCPIASPSPVMSRGSPCFELCGQFAPPSEMAPSSKPRISSPLAREVDFHHHHHHHPSNHTNHTNHPTSQHHQKQPCPSRIALTLTTLVDLSITITVLVCLSIQLQSQINALCSSIKPSSFFKPWPSAYHDLASSKTTVVSAALVKSLSGICLVLTGTRPASYIIKTLSLYAILAFLVVYLNPSHPLSTLVTLAIILVGSLVIVCLPLLRLIENLFELEDQQSASLASHRFSQIKIQTYPAPPMRKNLDKRDLFKIRYQHLMSPF
ncbi:hypothetical protein O181_090167 [Austropuccinia psidii MF-1]|uniref:Transmembrane protein n=1 Tax=Austropuccinia psidii MF-1 TaxID=1389203 RepID=A0A9Q3IUU8_9BASI|nr:hypothetical protein [Austropuccinia psidii MF-1]